MFRKANLYLQEWLIDSNRKPLIIRGARQVGKTWLVRDFAKNNDKTLLEINLEKNPSLFDLFSSNNPKDIIDNLEATFDININLKNSLLFIDEIQTKPECLAKLRWFAEDLPELAVIAAGSLLEFTLLAPKFSMPVGRINYLYLEPMSFEEFLLATNNNKLKEFLYNYTFNKIIPENIHSKLIALFNEYMLIGGMPAACQAWANNKSNKEISIIHNNLITTYRDDFNKYNNQIAIERLEEVMYSIPMMVGNKYVYSKVNPDIQIKVIKESLSLLSKARLCHYVYANYANGIPLGAQINEKFFKMLFLDCGLAITMLGLDQNILSNKLNLINKGAIAEQITGQLLRTLTPEYIDPKLYYWQRNQTGSAAEIDYVIQHQDYLVPIEVKSGTTGTLKSLHLFMAEKQLKKAVRINADKPSIINIDFNTQINKNAKYTLISIPFYLIEQLIRLLLL